MTQSSYRSAGIVRFALTNPKNLIYSQAGLATSLNSLAVFSLARNAPGQAGR